MGDHLYNSPHPNPIKFLAAQENEIWWWRIRGENDTGDGGWKSSVGMDPLGVGTENITIKFDDDFSGDNDFNDQIIEVTLIYPTKFDEKFISEFDINASGPTGTFTYIPPTQPIIKPDPIDHDHGGGGHGHG